MCTAVLFQRFVIEKLLYHQSLQNWVKTVDLELFVNEREKCLKYLKRKESFASETKSVLISIFLTAAFEAYTPL